jgi:hypothetical protein
VVFVGATGEEKELSMTARTIKATTEKPSASAKVKIVAPYRVSHEGVAYTGGDVPEVPTATADLWVKSGWAEPVSEKEK